MSREYYLYRHIPTNDAAADPAEQAALALGEPTDVRETIKHALPEIVWNTNDSSLGYVADHGYIIEFNLLPNDLGIINCVAVAPHGIADEREFVRRSCTANKWFMHDPQKGIWIGPSDWV